MKIVAIFADGETREYEYLVQPIKLLIDGQPYHPPAPKRQRWECEVKLAGGNDWCHASDMDCGPNVKARAKLAFWSTGEVAFADEDARVLAAQLNELARTLFMHDIAVRQGLRKCALRLAGPEEG